MTKSEAQMGHKVSSETRIKLSVALMGHVMSPEARAKISAARTGRTLSPESRAKVSAAQKGKTGPLYNYWNGGPLASRRRQEAKRRILGFIPLNEYFEGADAHHVDCEHVVYIPRKLHQSVRHNVFTGKNMDKINAIAINYVTPA